MAITVRSLSSPSLMCEKYALEKEESRKNNSSPALSRVGSEVNEETLTVEQSIEGRAQKVDSVASSKLNVPAFDEEERETFIKHFMTKFGLSRDVAEAQYDAFV